MNACNKSDPLRIIPEISVREIMMIVFLLISQLNCAHSKNFAVVHASNENCES